LNPSVLIELAISRTCAETDLRSLREYDFKASIEQRSTLSDGRTSLRRGLLAPATSVCPVAAFRRERPFTFKPRLPRRKSTFLVFMV
jgi:hypothetical protein